MLYKRIRPSAGVLAWLLKQSSHMICLTYHSLRKPSRGSSGPYAHPHTLHASGHASCCISTPLLLCMSPQHLLRLAQAPMLFLQLLTAQG